MAGPPGHRPTWAPEGVDLEAMPQEIRRAVAEIVQPAYEQLVVRADGLEKSIGVTITHLLWLEVLQQFDMKRELCDVSTILGLPANCDALIAKHLRLVESKVRVGHFLLRIRELHHRWAQRCEALLTRPSLPARGPLLDPPAVNAEGMEAADQRPRAS